MQRSRAASAATWPKKKRLNFYESLSPQALSFLKYYWPFWARPNQLWPKHKHWRTWLILAGRGWGKTLTGAQATLEAVRRGYRRIGLIGRTIPDVRDVMVNGETGIVTVASPQWRPRYWPSKRCLVWANGATAMTYSADKPDQLRGPQHDFVWCEELAAWPKPDMTQNPAAWANMNFGLRLGNDPKCIVTTTPRAVKVIKELRGSPDVLPTIGSTYENMPNLAPAFFETIIKPYEGTRIGRQELLAEILEDIEGALWTQSLIDEYRMSEPPEMERIVVAIDPASTAKKTSDETGINVAGRGIDGHFYVFSDLSGKFMPPVWAKRAVVAYYDLLADRIIGETNNGGDMIEATIRAVDPAVPYRGVTASRGKTVRAEPIAALYEQGLVHHIGHHPKLEEEMTTWVPGMPSPSRMDALVWALTDLSQGHGGISSGVY